MAVLTRRNLAATFSSACIGGTAFRKAQAQATPYSALIVGQYANAITIRQVAGLYVAPGPGNNIVLAPTAYRWSLQIGSYLWSRSDGHPVLYTGYWLFRTDGRRMCWQAAGDAGALDFWNWDGQAKGSPEDFELFRFVEVNAAGRIVKIGHKENAFVGVTGNTLNCNSGVTNAGQFEVIF